MTPRNLRDRAHKAREKAEFCRQQAKHASRVGRRMYRSIAELYESIVERDADKSPSSSLPTSLSESERVAQ